MYSGRGPSKQIVITTMARKTDRTCPHEAGKSLLK
jgi:hypothetical protein